MGIAAGIIETSLLFKFEQWEQFGDLAGAGRVRNADSIELTNFLYLFISSDYGTTTFEKVESSLGCGVSNGRDQNPAKQMKPSCTCKCPWQF